MESMIAKTPKGKIEYTLLGNGPVVLVCHGTSSDCFSVDGNSPLLEAGFSLLTPSRPGYGQTPLETGMSASQAADAFAALLVSLNIKTCSVMAISGGGPTGISLAANWPQMIQRFALMDAITKPEARTSEASYQSQVSFYGPMHGLMWGMLRLISSLSPQNMARQTMTIFSTHDPEDTLRQLTPEDILNISHFYQRRSSRKGALNDFKHTVGKELLQKVQAPTLVVHSREDNSVPFSHAEWSLSNIPNSTLCESGVTGHFYWVGPDYQRVSQTIVRFFTGEKPG